MENTGDKGEIPALDKEEYCTIEGNNIEKDIIYEDMKYEDGQDAEHLNLITNEVDISTHTLHQKLSQWREIRKCTVKSLQELADYLDNIGSLGKVVVAVRSGILNRSIAVGSGILTFAFGISVPFLIAGAGIGMASLVED